MTDKKTISVLLDPEVVDQLAELQSEYKMFSRSRLIREVIQEGLKTIKQVKENE